jgi:GNAT superfamily N-acetyltransferase
MVTLERVDPDDAAAIASYVEAQEAVRVVDSPWVAPKTTYRLEMDVRYGWEGNPAQYYLVRSGGGVVGYGWLETFVWDNPDFAWIHVSIRPDLRRRGHGTAAAELLLEECRGLGRSLIGLDSWESDGAHAFALALGFELKSRSAARRQSLRELPGGLIDAVYAEAAEHAGAYELFHAAGPVPEELIGEAAVVAASINDAPLDDLEIEDDVYVPERIRAFEQAHAASRQRILRVVARHRGTGAMAGHTVVIVDDERPAYAAQEDTAVAREHRGHRLGLLLKADMCRWLLESEPAVDFVDTWNAASNDHMVGVNERLGYEITGHGREYQRRI